MRLMTLILRGVRLLTQQVIEVRREWFECPEDIQ